MIRNLFFTALLSIFFCGVASADLLVKDGQNVVFMGDSITALGWGQRDGYIHLTVEGFKALGVNITAIPAGVSGNTSKDMLARLKTDVLDQKPDWVTLSCGVNDVWHGAGGCSLEEYSKNITSIVDQATAAGIKVLIMTPTVINEEENENNTKMATYIDFLHKLAAERHLPVAEENAAYWEIIKKGKDQRVVPLTGDGVHPVTEGSLVMGRALVAGFGASPAQMEQAEAAWEGLPATMVYKADLAFYCNENITLKQYEGLKKLAASQKLQLNQLLDNILVPLLGEAIQKHQKDANQDNSLIQQETQKAFLAKLAELTK